MGSLVSKLAWYSGFPAYDSLLTFALAVTALLLKNSKYQKRAPYGRFGSENKHMSLDPRFGWWLMELPATVMFLYGFWRGLKNMEKNEDKSKRKLNLTQKLMFLIWLRHYGNRGWYFPLTIRVAEGGKSTFALFNSAIGAIFLSIHGYLNGRNFTDVGHYTTSWLKDPRFLVGMVLYEIGFWITVHSESVFRNLRPAGVKITEANRYKIPYGGMFKYITNPQYFGELLAWTGFNVLTWSPTAMPVLMISLANLVPRSFENHKWYLKKFQDYPQDRKALVPFLL